MTDAPAAANAAALPTDSAEKPRSLEERMAIAEGMISMLQSQVTWLTAQIAKNGEVQ